MFEHITATQPSSPHPIGGTQATPSKVLSLLELLHPQGIAIRSLVIGSRCPEMLRPWSQMAAKEGNADLIILAPTARECRINGWVQEAIRSISQKLELNGVAYVLAPPLWRLRIRKLLSEYGLSIDQELLHLPDQELSRYLVPLSPIPAQYAFSNLLPLPKWGRLLATIAFHFFRCDQLFKHIVPSVGMAARRPGARPLFEWLFRLHSPRSHGFGSVIISRSWRGRDGAVILHRFVDRDDSLSAVAKMYLAKKPFDSLIREAEILDRLGPSARNAGAQIPQRLSFEQINEYPVLLQSMICGQSVASLLCSQPNRLMEIIKCLISWLEVWNRTTVVTRPLDREYLEKELLTSAALLAPVLQQGDDYRNYLAARYLPLTGVSVPFVATHNDLTMWNLLLEDKGRLGVIDWESAIEQGFPFMDFFYAMTDAVTAVHGYDDRKKAFEECFALDGSYAHLVGQFLTRLRRAVHTPDEIVGLSFHACWLHHAANEYRSTGPSDPRPFLQLVQWLSVNRANLCKWVHG